jgi:trans-aconitate 2-methyltransferase
MSDWSARQYLKFKEERTRPARDLLAHVQLEQARVIVDLGCGPGNSTELLVARYPDAEVIGVDSSSDMLREAHKRSPNCSFVQAHLSTWRPANHVDLLFSSGAFQWVPDHQTVLQRFVQVLPECGVLAVQIPDITEIPALALMREVASKGPWADNPAMCNAVRDQMPKMDSYYDGLKPLCAHVDIWHTTYNHVLAGPEAIVEWFMGSALLPLVSGLDPEASAHFLAAFATEIERHHKRRVDGRVLLELPRLFIVATR